MHLAIPGVATNTYTVLGVASARIYHAQLNTKTPEWCYSRMKGTLVFGKDRDPDTIENAPMAPSVQAGNHWFRLLDTVSGKPVWIFKVRPGSGFIYEIDRPFFHAFQGKSRRFGFLFDNDDEASALAKEVISQISPPRPKRSLSMRSKAPSSRRPLFPSMVSLPAPNSFVHVAHVGLNKDGVVEASEGIDPSWRALLEGHGLRGQTRTIDSELEHDLPANAFWRGLDSKTDFSVDSKDTLELQPKTRRRIPVPRFTVF